MPLALLAAFFIFWSEGGLARALDPNPNRAMGYIKPLRDLNVYSCANFNRKISRRYSEDTKRWEYELFRDNKGCLVKERMLKLAQVRIVWVNYALLRADFDSLREKSDPEIDDILIDQAGYITADQVLQEVVNSKIPHTEEERVAYRPPTYGRATVVEFYVDGIVKGLLDIKGVGLHPFLNHTRANPANRGIPFLHSKKIVHGQHGDGLLKMGEGIRETLYEQLVNRILLHSQADFYTVGTYAVLDAGFDVISDKGERDPAALYVRQAHDRKTPFDEGWEGNAWPNFDLRRAVADLMEIYGLTARKDPNMPSLEERRKFDIGRLEDGVNIQTTRDERGIMDFGHYTAFRKSEVSPGDISVDYELWGYHGEQDRVGFNHSLDDRPAQYTYELVRSLYDSKQTWNEKRHWVHQHIRNMVGPIEDNLAKIQKNDAAAKRLGFDQFKGEGKVQQLAAKKASLRKVETKETSARQVYANLVERIVENTEGGPLVYKFEPEIGSIDLGRSYYIDPSSDPDQVCAFILGPSLEIKWKGAILQEAANDHVRSNLQFVRSFFSSNTLKIDKSGVLSYTFPHNVLVRLSCRERY